jgi:hypothetical protein
MIQMLRATRSFQIAMVMVLTASITACGGDSSSSTPASTSSTASSAPVTAQMEAQVSAKQDAQTTSAAYCAAYQCAVEFSATEFSATQNSKALVTVVREGGSKEAVSVTYKTYDYTATEGVDYTAETGTLTWAENDATSRTISVPITNGAPFSGTKTFFVALNNPSSAAQVGPGSVAAVVISDAETSNASAGTLKLSATSYTVNQNVGNATITVGRMNGTSGAVSVDYATNNGTAAAGTDYTAATGKLSWAAGDASSKSFTVAISNAKPFTGQKTLHVSLNSPAGATVASPNNSTIFVNGDGTAASGTLQLSAANYSVAQNAGKVTVTVDRANGTTGALSVAYATANGTAVAGTDYSAASGTLSWAAGDASAKSFTVAVSNATPFVGNKTFTVDLAKPSGTSVSNPGSATVTIAGDGASAVGAIGLSAPTYKVAQSAGGATVTVERADGTSGAVSVTFATADGTAVAGKDYTEKSGTLSWNSGDASAKSFMVPVSTATPFAGNKSFNVNLAKPSNGASLTATNTAGVVITGDASTAPGSFQLSAASYTVAQNAGSLSLTVNRTGGSTGAVTVAYATANGTAAAGTNYTATSGTLDWASGDASSKTISIPVSNATPFTGTKTLSLTLSSPSSGATLSTPSSAGITIDGSAVAASGSGGPSAVTNLQVVNQGGASLTSLSTQEISWTAAAAGSNPIASYNIYRNGALYANTKSTSYTDTNAPNSNVPTFSAPATVYSYNVAAVDSAGNVGPQTSNSSSYLYQDGTWHGSQDLSYDGVTANYKSTAGSPQDGPYDVQANFPGQGGWLTVASPPMVPFDDLEIGAFKYFTIDINPGNSIDSQGMQVIMQSRLPPGDETSWGNGYNIFNYGPAPKANTWATYKVPLSVMHFGVSGFTGSISGTRLTVTAVASGGFVDAGGWVTGPGVPAGTYIVGYNQSASIGSFTVAGPGINGSTNVPSESMTFQRTGFYKVGIQPNSLGGGSAIYFNNFGFTVN